jgi:ArsR family transcriptional regulator
MNGNPIKAKRYEAWARIIHALANPTRLFLVDELMKGPDRCVCELSELAGGEMSTISRHLAVLREAGIIQEQRQGRMRFYHLRSQKVRAFFDCAECCLRNATKD